jgi:hypothetical protein
LWLFLLLGPVGLLAYSADANSHAVLLKGPLFAGVNVKLAIPIPMGRCCQCSYSRLWPRNVLDSDDVDVEKAPLNGTRSRRSTCSRIPRREMDSCTRTDRMVILLILSPLFVEVSE